MAEAFNPYREWLGLDTADDPNHYDLLSLRIYEDDPDAISLAAERSSTKVRSFRPGPNAAAWSRLLDKIRAARECLLDVNEKVDYDRKLRSGSGSTSVRSSVASEAGGSQSARSSGKANADFYPPGMGPPTAKNSGNMAQPPTPVAATGKATSVDAASESEGAPVDALSMLPPGLSVDAAPAASGHGGGSYYSQPAASEAVAAAPDNSSWAQPAAANNYGMPAGGAPMMGGPHPGMVAPMALPVGAMPVAGMPAAYAGYPGAPMSAPMAQPYGAQPYGNQPYAAQPYGAPGMGYPAAQPIGYPGGAPMAQPMAYGNEAGAYGVGGGYAAPTAHDPMAPLAMPGVLGSSYGTPHAAAVIPGGAIPQGSIPTGSAVASSGAPLPGELAPGLPKRSSASATVLAAKRERASRRTLLFAGAGGALMLLAAAVIFVVIANNQPPVEVVEAPQAEALSSTGEPAEPIERSTESALPTQPKTLVPPTGNSPPTPTPMPTTIPSPPPTPESPSPMPVPLTPEPVPPSPATPTPTPATPSPEPTPPPTPPTPPVPVPDPAVTITPAQAIKLGKALADAKVALAEQNFEEADKQLAIAEPLAKLPDHAAKLARLKEAANYVQQFRDVVAESVAAMEAGSTFKVGTSAMVAVVETFPNKIIVRAAGQNREYPFQDLPPGLAVAIADLKLDASEPANRVIKAAYLAVTKPDDEEVQSKAKAWLEEASLGGVDVTSMQMFLTDKYDNLAKDIPAAKE